MSQDPRTESLGSAGAKPAARIELLAGGTELANRFEVRGVLGTGGYAVVYRAFDRSLEREVALKVLRHDRLSQGALLRLRREAAVARDVVHPRIVRIFDIEEAGETVFLTMEIVEGGSLVDRLARHAAGNPVPIDDAVKWATQALEGLAALHGLGILHRDIKPGNLLLTAENDVKLSDFGLALHLDRDETRATTHESVLGTLEYLSPEQALGQPVDARSDLYSIGVVLFEMIAGRLPFVTQSSLGSLLERLRQDETPDLAELRADTPSWLAAVVRRLLERDPIRRYPSADAVLADLRSRSAGSSRPSASRRSRRRRWAAAAALGLALVATSWGIRSWQRSRFSHIVPDGDSAVKALDGSGRTLWTLHGIHRPGNFLPIRTARLGWTIAANLMPADRSVSTADSFLDLLDPQTGKSVDRIRLPSGHAYFTGFSDSYVTWMDSLDVEGDGLDEVLVSFAHSPYYPSYNVLVEPDRSVARLVFVSSGHHRLVGAADLDGDGRREILLGGINNRIGWASGLAAVRLSARLSPNGEVGEEDSIALDPNLPPGTLSNTSLIWYELLPPPWIFNKDSRLEVDTARRRLRLGSVRGAHLEIGFDGFLADTDGAWTDRPASEREERRRAAYDGLRDSSRLASSGRPREAAEVLRTAVAAARAVGDPMLVDWMRRRMAKVTLVAGDRRDALALYEELWQASPAASEVAFECARSLHGLGDLDGAITWYRRGLGKGAAWGFGRAKYEVEQGLMFALSEQRRYSEAADELDHFDAAYPNQPMRAERVFLSWLQGDSPTLATFPTDWQFQDLHLYWRLEVRLRLGDDPRLLLEELRASLPLRSSYGPLFDGLEGELLARLGQKAEAVTRLETALRQARLQSTEEPNYRVHIPILEQRLSALRK